MEEILSPAGMVLKPCTEWDLYYINCLAGFLPSTLSFLQIILFLSPKNLGGWHHLVYRGLSLTTTTMQFPCRGLGSWRKSDQKVDPQVGPSGPVGSGIVFPHFRITHKSHKAPSWWLNQPIWKIFTSSQIGSFPPGKDKNKIYLKLSPSHKFDFYTVTWLGTLQWIWRIGIFEAKSKPFWW